MAGNPQQMLAKADTDGDGVISEAEFAAFQPTSPNGQALPAPTDEMKQEMFARLDQDGDGTISAAELQAAPPPPSPADGSQFGMFGQFPQ